MWVRTNNYKFHTFRSVHFHLSLSPRPSFRFSEGRVPRLANARELSNMYFMAVWVGVEWTDGMEYQLTKIAKTHYHSLAKL